MRRIVFPPIEEATEDGLVAVGGDLETDTLIEAYRNGIFPWPISIELPLAWFSPDPRGILFFDELHLPKSFEKFLKKTDLRVTFNQAFSEVLRACARVPRKGQPGTWITPDIVRGYEKLFAAGLAYSVEVYDEEELVAGVYGVCMGDFISGESMFTVKDNASKLALHALIQNLKAHGVRWMDTQMVTSVVEHFGGKYVSRVEFLRHLSAVDWTKKRAELFEG